MFRILSLLICLVMCACGQSPVAKTAAVTNSKHILGIVPLQGGAAAKDQRYRLLVCRKLPTYGAAAFADKNVCRSALLSKGGQEVDFIGNKLDAAHKDVAHLEFEFAPEVRELGQSPIGEKRGGSVALGAVQGVLAGTMGVMFINYISTIDGMRNTKLPTHMSLVRIATIGVSALLVGFGALVVVGAVRKGGRLTKRNERRKRIGDDAGRAYPKPIKASFYALHFGPTDLITHQHWQDISSVDFHYATNLEYESNLLTILVAMARFYKLEINADALAL